MSSDAYRQLYPEIAPFDTGFLRVSDLHTLYYEQCGNPEGKPVVFVHGGPGGGCDAKCRRFFDPKAYRIVLFDQRGCGRSTPNAELTDNTTWDSVADIERLREKLRIERWQVFGGSWGSTLSLAYAEAHPERVTELVLRGIFMLRRSELEWFYQKGANALYPDAWEAYEAAIPEAERGDMMSAYYRRLTSDDKAVRTAAARAWSVWE
ncbi:MAG: prolyl aminopeptidase, partial [Gammaproteobacteria bacterium]